MKIIKPGKTIRFVCGGCDCEFTVGIHVVHTPDNGENYYANCPMCGADCHTDVVRLWMIKDREKEKKRASYSQVTEALKNKGSEE